MIGRGAVTTPDLVNCVRQSNDSQRMTWQDLLTLQVAFLNGHYKTEIGLIGRYKQWLGMMTKAYPEATELWQQIKRIKDMEQLLQVLTQQND
jgi:tRNA-dihydrouridine synthase C